MKIILTRPMRAAGIAWMVITVALPVLSAAGQEEKSAPSQIQRPDIRFTPVVIERNSNGTPKRGPQAAIVTKNWSGFIVRSTQTGEYYTSAAANWTVPKVTYYPSFDLEISSEWVGIGGACLNDSYLSGPCDNKDRTLVQVITAQRATPTGPIYLARYELLPSPAVTIPVTISPGDRVSASVQCVANCSSATQTWTLSFVNQTTNSSWTQSFTYASREASAEWIEEAPTQSMVGIVPLADFDMATLGPQVMANGQTPTLNMPQNGFVMHNPYGQWASPSQSARGQNGFFNVCWYATTPGPIPCMVP